MKKLQDIPDVRFLTSTETASLRSCTGTKNLSTLSMELTEQSITSKPVSRELTGNIPSLPMLTQMARQRSVLPAVLTMLLLLVISATSIIQDTLTSECSKQPTTPGFLPEGYGINMVILT